MEYAEAQNKRDDMGVGYTLVNFTKKECIIYLHIPANTAREITGNPVAAAITTWYLLQHPSDNISFVSDTYDDWPFPEGDKSVLPQYQEVTERVVYELIDQHILVDEGQEIFWNDEPDVYIRKLRNVWMT